MKRKFFFFLCSFFIVFSFTPTFASDYQAVIITKPVDRAVISGPVTVCMSTWGLEVEPAKNGVNEGKGHHHLLVDADLPSDLNQPIGKDSNHIHMGDGSTCKTLTLSPGKHTIRTLFAKGNHFPYGHPVTDSIDVNVR